MKHLRFLARPTLAVLLACAGCEKLEQPGQAVPAAAARPEGAERVAQVERVADEATLLLPADAHVVIRFASRNRLDAIGKDWQVLWDLIGDDRPLSKKLLPPDVDRLPIDPGRPYYLAWSGLQPVWVLPAQAGAELPRPRNASYWDVRPEGGMLRVGPARVLDKPRRTEPLAVLEGDASLFVAVTGFAADATAQLRKAERELKKVAREDLPIPPVVWRLASGLLGLAVTILEGTESVEYALTWREGKLYSEGFVRTVPDSELHAFLSRIGPPSLHGLVGYLPEGGLMTIESNGHGSWLDGQVAAAIDGALGEGAGADLLLLLGPSYALHPHLSGKGAGTISVSGIMSFAMRSVWQVKPGARLEQAIGAIDTERVARRLAELGIPARVRLRRNAASVGETAIHRLTYETDLPQAAMLLPMIETAFAVEGEYLLTVQSTTAMRDIEELIARVREGQPGDHSHLRAMARLMERRHEGMTINLGALKPLLGMAAGFVPDASALLKGFPDELDFSTALSVVDGHIHLRGDWPVSELLEFAATLK